MNYDQAYLFINNKIQQAIDALNIGRWVLVDENGIICNMIKPEYSFATKASAIEDYRFRKLDERKTFNKKI